MKAGENSITWSTGVPCTMQFTADDANSVLQIDSDVGRKKQANGTAFWQTVRTDNQIIADACVDPIGGLEEWYVNIGSYTFTPGVGGEMDLSNGEIVQCTPDCPDYSATCADCYDFVVQYPIQKDEVVYPVEKAEVVYPVRK